MNSFEMDISFNNEYNNIIIYKLKKKTFYWNWIRD